MFILHFFHNNLYSSYAAFRGLGLVQLIKCARLVQLMRCARLVQLMRCNTTNPTSQSWDVMFFTSLFTFISFLILRAYQTDMEDSIKSCISLLDDPDIEIAIRVGDVYALLVNHFTACQDYQQVCLFCAFWPHKKVSNLPLSNTNITMTSSYMETTSQNA